MTEAPPATSGYGHVALLSVGLLGLIGAALMSRWDNQLRAGAMWLSLPAWLVCLRGVSLWRSIARGRYAATLAVVVVHWWTLGTVWGLAVRDARFALVPWILAVVVVQAMLLTGTAIVAGARGVAGAIWSGSGWAAFLIGCLGHLRA